MAISTMNRVKGGLYGAVVGDVIGVPYEFKEPNVITAVGGESVLTWTFPITLHQCKRHTLPFRLGIGLMTRRRF